MAHIHILCIASEHIYTEIITIFQAYFRVKGHFVSYEYAFKKEPEQPFSEDVNIIIKAQRHFDPKTLPRGSQKILFQSEQYDKLRQFDSMPYSKPWDLILDVFKDNVDRMHKVSKGRTRFLPIGYHDIYNLNRTRKPILDHHCELECYFFGARTKWRTAWWNENVKPISPRSRFANTDLGGKKYHNIIHSRVNLFIPGWEPYLLPTMHMMQVIANKKILLVVSDTQQNFSPYIEGFHFALTDTKSAQEMIKKLIHGRDFRYRFESKMFDDITTNHKFENYLDVALEGFV